MTRRRLPPSASVAQSADGGKLHAPAAAKNAAAIGAVLDEVVPATGNALELASGTGQHIVAFAERFPDLTWQPTEVDEARLASIQAHRAEAHLPNLQPPILLNATQAGWGRNHASDLILLINLLHLISATETQSLMAEVAQALNVHGRFVIYGPFMRDGQLTSDGDRSFHASLKASDPDIGYKNDAEILAWLKGAGLRIAETIEMPANNLAIIAKQG